MSGPSESDETVGAAEVAIMHILRDLELKLGTVVHEVELVDLDVTRIDHDRQQILRRIRIYTRRNPGTKWDI